MNRKDIDCNVIIDLLPLYKEEICSEATRELVEEHLRSCEDCRQLCENMTLPEPEKKAVPDEAETFKKVGKKVKRGKFYRRALIFIFAVFAALNVAWLKLKFFPYKEFSADMGEYNGDCYQVCEGGYYYNVIEPHYLSFFDGKLYIWKEMAGKEEVLTAKFFIGDTQYGDDTVETVEAGGTKEFVVNVTLDDIISGDAYFVVFNDEINLESEKVAITKDFC